MKILACSKIILLEIGRMTLGWCSICRIWPLTSTQDDARMTNSSEIAFPFVFVSAGGVGWILDKFNSSCFISADGGGGRV